MGIVLVMAIGVPAFADGPAVSAPNAKLDILGGSFDGDWGYIAAGSGSLPLGKRFGFQLDAGIGSIGEDRYYGFLAGTFLPVTRRSGSSGSSAHIRISKM